jgi:hypothetical protein
MIITPKQAFIESKHRKEHEDTTQKQSFQVACDYALLVLIQDQPEAIDPSKGWDSHSQLVGARKVLNILKTLHLPEAESKPVKQPKLKYGI